MRISDWSSDVCSSDLRCPSAIRNHPSGCRLCNSLQRARNMICDPDVVIRVENLKTRFGDHIIHQDLNLEVHRGEIRSEEHTSELQSLMRISYAVFCLKKKKK